MPYRADQCVLHARVRVCMCTKLPKPEGPVERAAGSDFLKANFAI